MAGGQNSPSAAGEKPSEGFFFSHWKTNIGHFNKRKDLKDGGLTSLSFALEH